jgi:hypothetical protein
MLALQSMKSVIDEHLTADLLALRGLGETNGAYHGDLAYYGSTQIRCYRESPARFRDLYVTRTLPPEPPSNEMVLGSVTHCLVAGLPVGDEFLVAEGCASRRGKAWDGWEDEAAQKGLQVVLPEQLEKAQAMAGAVMAHPIAGQLFRADGPVEHSIRWTDPATGLPLKCKPDKLILGPPCVTLVDLKSSSIPAPNLWTWTAWWKYAYHIQAALYLAGVRTHVDPAWPCEFVFAVVGNKPPHDVYVYKLAHATRDLALRELNDTLGRLRLSLDTGDWSAPEQNQINDFNPPRGIAYAEDVSLVIDGEEVSV